MNTTDNTTVSPNVNGNTKAAPSRWEEAANDFASLIKFLFKKAIFCIVMLIVTAYGSYFGINYYYTEQAMIDEELYPLTASQASDAIRLMHVASRYMQQIEYAQNYSDNESEHNPEAAEDALSDSSQQH